MNREVAEPTPPVVFVAELGAEIEVHNVIALSGHGVVLIGHVRAGRALAGQVTRPLVLGQALAHRLEISSVERLSSLETSDAAVGLVFRNPPLLEELRRALPQGSFLLLETPGDTSA